jgi:hypothetical protein
MSAASRLDEGELTYEQAVRLRELRQEAQHASDRYRLYKAWSYSHPSDPGRLRSLARAATIAQGRLDRRAGLGAPVARSVNS